MHPLTLRPLPVFVAVPLLALPLAALSTAALAQTRTSDGPTKEAPTKPLRSIPYVSIQGDDGKQHNYETNAIPLLYNRACFGWRMYLGGPNRAVSITEVLTTSTGRTGDRRPRDRGERRQDQGHDAHARTRAGRRAAAFLVHHPGRSARHLHLQHLDRRRAARRVRVLRHRDSRPESQYRSARPQLPQQVQRGRARPARPA